MRRASVHPAARCAHAGRAAGYPREDALGGIDFAQARFYDPLIGRFLSPDSIVPNPADPQSLNRFSYSLNNPVKYTDPSGHWVDRPGEEQDPPDEGQHMVTGSAGIIDRKHAISSRALAFHILQSVKKLTGHGGTFGYLADLGGKLVDFKITWVIAPGTTMAQAEGIALAIYQDYQMRFEQAQGDHGFFWSKFSFEDLPSDQVAFYMAKTGYNLGSTLEDLGGYKGSAQFGTIGDIARDVSYPKNREFRPIHTDGSDRGKNYDWPERFNSELAVQPIQTGWSVSSYSFSTPLSKVQDWLRTR